MECSSRGAFTPGVATTWWAFITALLVGTRFVLPNKLRSWRDPNTNVRLPGHLVLKLEFGDLSFAGARALQAGLGAHFNQCNRGAEKPVKAIS